ncbi:MAG: chalcone isomerase family protein [Acidiferrobacterales bacterium]
MKTIQILAALWLLSVTSTVFALEIENVKLPDSISSTTPGAKLLLNGAGIRTKFIFDIYVGALYLESKDSNAEKIINSKGEKQIFLHFLYKEVTKKKLTAGWTDGFEDNNSSAQMAKLKDRLNKFNAMFITVKKGNTMRFDFLPDGLLKVSINNETRGEINGYDFQQALLKVWLGQEPATEDLKAAMLGKTDE